MKRRDLEHLIRTAADLADDDEIIVVGSKAILGAYPEAPASLLVSNEADLFPKNHPERWDLIDGSIGEESPFHRTFGYYAQGVSETTAVLPSGWRDRLVAVRNANTRMATGWCLEPHDLVLSKCVADREKDRAFLEEALRHHLVDASILLERAKTLPTEVERIANVEAAIRAASKH